MFLSGMNVFPLVKMDQFMDGYFMDKDGNVYSNKANRSGVLTKLAGSSTPSGRYYTMNKRTHRADQLVALTRRHALFEREVTPVASPSTPATAPAQSSEQIVLSLKKSKSANGLIRTKGYVLATVGPNDKLLFGSDPVFQLDLPTATTEAERIANLKPGTRVVLLQAVRSVVAGGTKWE